MLKELYPVSTITSFLSCTNLYLCPFLYTFVHVIIAMKSDRNDTHLFCITCAYAIMNQILEPKLTNIFNNSKLYNNNFIIVPKFRQQNYGKQ